MALAALALLATAGAAGYLHLQNAQLRRRLERQRPAQQQTALLREENTRLRQVVASHAQDREAAAATVRSQLEQTRHEITALEKKAAVQRNEDAARAIQEANALETQRNPTLGLTRLEHFRDLGQGTPSATFETMVRAVLKGDEASLTRMFVMPAKTRTQADALIARLPEEARAKWTPEKLALLWVTGALTEMSALQITSERFESSDSAVVTFRGPQNVNDEKVNLRLTPEGWKIVVGSGMISNLEKQLSRRD